MALVPIDPQAGTAVDRDDEFERLDRTIHAAESTGIEVHLEAGDRLRAFGDTSARIAELNAAIQRAYRRGLELAAGLD